MTRTAVARLAILAAMTVAAAVGLHVALLDAGPFNERFIGCDAESADWKLVVHYQIEGRPDEHLFEAHYRRLEDIPVFTESGWLTGRSTDSMEILEWSSGGYCLYVCCCGQGGGSSESISVWPTDSAEGVDLEIKHGYLAGKRETKTAERLKLPFRRDLRGEQGPVAYDASWTPVVRK